jgi:hypothetical protein
MRLVFRSGNGRATRHTTLGQDRPPLPTRSIRPSQLIDRRPPRRAAVGRMSQTQPVGFGSPATLQAPFAGPDGNSS